MTDDFLNISIQLAEALKSAEQDDITRTPLFRGWLSAAYDEEGFMYLPDYGKVYDMTHEQKAETLTYDQARARLTFFIRQMRFEYPPYSCMRGGAFADCLSRITGLEKEKRR